MGPRPRPSRPFPFVEPVSGSAEPSAEGFDIVVSDALKGVDGVEKSTAMVVSGYPIDVSAGDLVVGSDKRTSVGPGDQRASLPVQIEPPVFEFVLA